MDLSKTNIEVVVIFIISVLFIFFCGLVFFLMKFRKRTIRHKVELALTEDSTREKTLQQISHDLHDEVGGSLSGISLFVQMAQLHADGSNNPRLSDFLNKIYEYNQSVIEKTTDLVWMLQPENDTSPKMVERLHQFAESVTGAAGIVLEFHLYKNFVLPVNELGYRRNVFLICKEAVNNAVKHSGCTRLTLRVENGIISITDNGDGFDMAARPSGNGIVSMQLRAKDSNIKLAVKSQPGEGCSITLHL